MTNKITKMIGASLPSFIYPLVYSIYTHIHPDKDPIAYKKEDNCYKAINKKTNECIYVHEAKYLYRIQSEGMKKFHHRLFKKYTLDDFAEINEGDVVIDVGAHVGGFSLSAAELAKHVYTVEPDPRVQEALSRTTGSSENISIHQVALSDYSGQVEFLLGPDPSENSLINVDGGQEAQQITVNSKTLEDFVESIEHESVDFFKLDAEGAEPEVIRGFGKIRPATVAIDAGPEREGKTTRDTVQKLLESNGYETRIKNNIVIGQHIN